MSLPCETIDAMQSYFGLTMQEAHKVWALGTYECQKNTIAGYTFWSGYKIDVADIAEDSQSNDSEIKCIEHGHEHGHGNEHEYGRAYGREAEQADDGEYMIPVYEGEDEDFLFCRYHCDLDSE